MPKKSVRPSRRKSRKTAVSGSRSAAEYPIVTTDHLPGFDTLESLGLVQGSSVRVIHLGKEFLTGLKAVAGGSISEYQELLGKSREIAISRCRAAARKRRAHAVIGFRTSTHHVSPGVCEVVAYGTAVKVKRRETS